MITLLRKIMPAAVLLLCLLVICSCRKGQYPKPSPVKRQIQFELFTSRDFSKENDSIRFSLFIDRLSNQPIWDSALAPMVLKDIPLLPKKLKAIKSITDTGVLRCGFRYEIKNVGHSGISDTVNAATVLKNIRFEFQ